MLGLAFGIVSATSRELVPGLFRHSHVKRCVAPLLEACTRHGCFKRRVEMCIALQSTVRVSGEGYDVPSHAFLYAVRFACLIALRAHVERLSL